MSLNALNHSIYPKLRLRREKNHGNILSKLGSKVTEGSLVLMPVLLSLLKHEAAIVVRQSIVCGTRFFCTVLEEIAQQLQFIGEVGRWLEDMWVWMVKFKDAVYSLASEPGPASVRALAVKFLEVYVLLFTSNASGHEGALTEEKARGFDVSKLVGLHPIFERSLLSFEVNKCLGLLLNLLLSASTAPVSLTIVVISCLSAIARKRPVYYDRILSALLAFDPDSQTIEGGHAASIRYSLKTAFVGFLRCTHHPSISESREKLIRALRSLNPGEATEHIIRQIDKMAKNAEHISRDARLSKDDRTSGQPLVPGDTISKRSMMLANDGIPFPDDVLAKRARHGVTVSSAASVPLAKDLARDVDDGSVDAANGFSSKLSLLDSDLTPAEQMIVMVGALLAEGERGAESLDILISQMQADLLADMVIVNMKYLPKTPSPLCGRLERTSSPDSTLQTVPSLAATATVDTSDMSSQILSSPTSGFNLSTSTPDTPPAPNTVAEAKRDPRRDPRRLDPRRSTATVGAQPVGSNMETDSDVQPGLDGLTGRAMPSPVAMKTDSSLVPLISKSEVAVSDISTLPDDKSTLEESPAILDQTLEKGRSSAVQAISDVPGSPIHVEPELETLTPSETTGNDSVDVSMLEPDHSSTVSSALVSEEPAHELPSPPLFIDLTDEQRKSLSALAVARITESYKVTRATGYTHERLCLLARLVSQVDASGDIIDMLEKYIVKDYHHQKGHELAMYILYHLHSVIVSDTKEQCDSSATGIYEKFLLGVAKFLCNILPASDKSFSRLLNEAPLLPDSIMKLLEDLCRTLGHDHQGKDTREGDRITQGLGAVWSLILMRPHTRQTCLNIALKCAVDSQDEVRGKAIRLVANKLHPLSFVTESIEQFAKNTILSLVDQRVPDKDLTLRPSSEQGMEVESQESSINDSRMLDSGPVEGENSRNAQLTSPTTPAVSLTQAQKYSSLFFALCIKKPQLLQLVFDVYGRAPKVVKQSIHWHVSDLARKLGPSCPELLHIISVFPDGSENLMALVLQVLTEEMTPSADLITTVKQLHQSKLKDAAILIPILSSLSKDEVLPIFPRLVDLPTEKFQTALARILQGSAHTGPALTPAEVLVAIHDINPEKDGVPLKKIMDACTTCFEQRTVFTQHVLVKALDELIKRTPLPLLFMRTVIQAIDAFPAMVDFVMEILSKLVTMQIWRMPKLWPGFLKCASQTQPHSFNVLLKLPPSQLENVLQKHPNIRSLLSSHASQGNISSSLPRYLNRICTIKHHRRIIKCPCLIDGHNV
ncbi:unnamed protein product [Spirodela intermedia]|uniref:Uncharacterized protein n=1 Tax=Spirodela intermedia TaxID=51605 RepID=A0A7I8JWB2_SPIIN|nr:unnamed protein product [Spirodela intermedia]